MRLARATVLASLALVASPLLAQDTRVEVTPFGGWRWGGELEAGDNVLFDRDVDVDESGVYGLRLNVAVTESFQIELQASRQSTEFTTGDDDLFGDDSSLLDVDLDTLQVGMLFQGGRGQVHPFGVFGLGFTRLDPEGRYEAMVPRESMAMAQETKEFLERQWRRQRGKVLGR